MIIEVVGHKGVVGNATYQWLLQMKDKSFQIFGRDNGDITPSYNKERAIISFICTPEATVPDVVRSIDYADLIVIRSTVPPGTCKELQKETGVHICHLPEFLVAATSVVDEFNRDYLILGACCEKHALILETIYSPYMALIVTDTATSEVLKLAKNNYLACQISFWNEVEKIAQKAGTTGHKVGKLAALDERISDYGACYHHKYGGACLPKDLEQMRKYASGHKIKTPLLDAVKEVNDCLES